MSTSLEEALGGSPVPAEPVVPVVEPATEPEAPAEAEAPQEAQETPEAPAEPQAEQKTDQHMVPVTVVKELRDEIRSLKAMQPAPAPVPVPDALDDPEGYAGHIQAQVNQAVQNATFNMSRAAAVRVHGEEAIAAAEGQVTPGTPEFQSVVNSPDPYFALMEHVQKQQAMAEIGDDPAAYRARIEAETRAKVEAEMAAKQVKGVAPPPSLASNPNVSARSGPAWSPTSLAAALQGRR